MCERWKRKNGATGISANRTDLTRCLKDNDVTRRRPGRGRRPLMGQHSAGIKRDPSRSSVQIMGDCTHAGAIPRGQMLHAALPYINEIDLHICECGRRGRERGGLVVTKDAFPKRCFPKKMLSQKDAFIDHSMSILPLVLPLVLSLLLSLPYGIACIAAS